MKAVSRFSHTRILDHAFDGQRRAKHHVRGGAPADEWWRETPGGRHRWAPRSRSAGRSGANLQSGTGVVGHRSLHCVRATSRTRSPSRLSPSQPPKHRTPARADPPGCGQADTDRTTGSDKPPTLCSQHRQRRPGSRQRVPATNPEAGAETEQNARQTTPTADAPVAAGAVKGRAATRLMQPCQVSQGRAQHRRHRRRLGLGPGRGDRCAQRDIQRRHSWTESFVWDRD